MGSLVRRIFLAAKNLLYSLGFADVKDSLSTSTPQQRGDLETAYVNFVDLMGKGAKAKLEELMALHSPITPEESVTYATLFAGIGAGGLALGAAGSTLAEIAGLGQIETLSDWLRDAWARLGLAAMVGVPIITLYDKAVRVPFTYWANSQFQPNIPGISDLVRFTVREAFPDIREEWIRGLPEDQAAEELKEMATLQHPFYLKFKEWAKYQGFSDYWADAYWHAHWILPSVSQIFEMRHRDLIDDETMVRMLTVSDIHPAWIDRLARIAFTVPRLVDIRTGWESGALDEVGLERRLKDRGYAPEDIPWIKKVFKYIVLRDETSRVRTQLVAQFREGFITESDLRTRLLGLGYREEVVGMILEEAKLRRDYEEKTEYLKFYMDSFIKKKITEEEFIASLKGLGMDDATIDRKKSIAMLKQRA